MELLNAFLKAWMFTFYILEKTLNDNPGKITVDLGRVTTSVPTPYTRDKPKPGI